MIKNLINLLLIVLSPIIFSCGNAPGEATDHETSPAGTDSFDYALPHGSSLPSKQLSEEDRSKLANAKGKEVIPIDYSGLIELLSEDQELLSIYSFWNLQCFDCLKLINSLNNLSSEPGFAGEFKLSLIYFGSASQKELNTYIRQNGITEAVYSVEDTIKSRFSEIHKDWTGELPALLIVNYADETKLFYQQTFSYEELQAILQPLIL